MGRRRHHTYSSGPSAERIGYEGGKGKKLAKTVGLRNTRARQFDCRKNCRVDIAALHDSELRMYEILTRLCGSCQPTHSKAEIAVTEKTRGIQNHWKHVAISAFDVTSVL